MDTDNKLTAEERFIRVKSKAAILGLDIVETKHNTVVLKLDTRSLQVINCSINNGTLSRKYDEVEVYRDFIICKLRTSLDEYSYDIYNKSTTDVYLHAESVTEIRVITTVNVIELNRDILILCSRIQFDIDNPYKREYKLISSTGQTLYITWNGHSTLNQLGTVENRKTKQSIFAFTSNGLPVITMDSDLNILYKDGKSPLETFNIKDNLKNKKNKLRKEAEVNFI